MDDDALFARIDEVLRLEQTEIRKREEAPYDGIMGKLPDWLPENFHREFEAIRNKLLATYRHRDLLDYIAEMHREWGMQGNRDAGELAELVELDGVLQERELGLSRGGMLSAAFYPRTPATIRQDVSRLAQFQEAVKLAEKVRQEIERGLLAEGLEPAKAAKEARMEGQKAGLALLLGDELAKAATKGKQFNQPGRGAGPIRKWIARQLKKNPGMKPAKLWDAFKANPLPDWEVTEPRYFKDIEASLQGPNGAKMGYRRFLNIASKERGKFKK